MQRNMPVDRIVSPNSKQRDIWREKAEQLIYTLSTLINSKGFLTVRTDVMDKISGAIGEFEKLIAASIENKLNYEQYYMDLKEKLSTVKGLHIRCPSNHEDLHYFSIQMFSALNELNLDMCPPSTIRGIYSHRQRLNILSIKNSGITDLAKVLAPLQRKELRKYSPMIFNDIHVSAPAEFVWSKLVVLKLSNCGICKLDESLHFFPLLQYLDLSHNSISFIIHLQDCISLKYLNLSHNRIRVLSNLERVIGSVTRLDVSHNEIESLDGIGKIYSLERISVANNYVSDYQELTHLSRLPNLEAIDLSENPLTEHPKYRLKVYTQLILEGTILQSNRKFPTLDGQVFRKREARKLRFENCI
jgi:Leucine-rich repeat (LRR) protein